MKHYMFSYGMNTNLIGMKSRCPKAKRIDVAVLDQHRLDFRLHADVIDDEDNVVHGLLWQLSDDDLDIMDIVEGYPRYYIRELLPVTTEDGRVYNAWVYKMNDQYAHRLPDGYYWDMVLEGYIENGIDHNQLYMALGRSAEYEHYYQDISELGHPR